MSYSDWLKKKEEEENKTADPTSGYANYVKRKEVKNGTAEKNINTVLNYYQSAMQSYANAASRYSNEDWTKTYHDDSLQLGEKELSNVRDAQTSVRNMFDRYKDYYDAPDYDKLFSANDKLIADVQNFNKQADSYYKNFTSQEDIDKYLQSIQDSEDAARKEQEDNDRWFAINDELKELQPKLDYMPANPAGEEGYKKIQNQAQNTLAQLQNERESAYTVYKNYIRNGMLPEGKYSGVGVIANNNPGKTLSEDEFYAEYDKGIARQQNIIDYRANKQKVDQLESEKSAIEARNRSRLMQREGAELVERLEREAKTDPEYARYVSAGTNRDGKEMDAQFYAYGGTTQGEIGQYLMSVTSQDKYNAFKLMSDEQYDTYRYLTGKYGADKADEYADALIPTLQEQLGSDIADQLKSKTFLEEIFGIRAGIAQFESGLNALANTEGKYVHPSATTVASQSIREDLGNKGNLGWVGEHVFNNASLAQIVYDTITTTANMVPSIATSALISYGAGSPELGEWLGAGLMGASAGGNAYQEMINAGYDKKSAFWYGALVGTSEAVLQKILGGISAFGGVAPEKISKALLSKVGNPLARVAIQMGGKMSGEFTEEYLQDVLEPVFKNICFDENNEVKFFSEEALYSGILGALSAALLEGAGTVSTEVNTARTGNVVKKTSGAAEALKSIGGTMSADSLAYKVAEKIDISNPSKLNAYELGLLFNEVGAFMTEGNHQDIVNNLVEQGILERDAELLATEFENVVRDGGSISDVRKSVLKDTTPLTLAVADVLIDKNTTPYQRMTAWNNTVEAVASKATEIADTRTGPFNAFTKSLRKGGIEISTLDSAGGTNVSKDNYANVKKAIGINGQFKVSEDGNTRYNGDGVAIKEIESVKDGVATVKLADGRSVNAADVEFHNQNTAELYEGISKMNVSAKTANALVKNYVNGENVLQYLLGMREAYEYGANGVNHSILPKTQFGKYVSETQQNIAWTLGHEEYANETKYKQSVINKTLAESAANREGSVTFDTKASEEEVLAKATDKQKTAIKVAGILAEWTGLQFRIFDSTEEGQNKSLNGKYYNGQIFIDLNAGQNYDGLMLFTMAHELTHFIQDFSPEHYEAFKSFLLDNYIERGESLDSLVEAQMRKNSRLTYPEALDEVVADSCERFLSDNDAITKLAELREADPEVHNKVGSFFKKLSRKIKEIYAKLNPNSTEANIVSSWGETTDKLQQMWLESLHMAGKAYKEGAERAAEKFLGRNSVRTEAEELSDADVKYSIREKDPPKKTGTAYKVFLAKDGQLYPPMVANPGGMGTPVGVWLDADAAPLGAPSKTGRMQVQAGGKGTNVGKTSLAYRPGWHLGDIPLAKQFAKLNPETGVKDLFPSNFVWAECEYAMDKDYQEEAMSYGYTESGAFRHSYAGLPKIPTDGYYRYRTNPNPDTVPWIITGAMRVKRILTDAETDAICREAGVEPMKRQGGELDFEKLGIKPGDTANAKYSFRDSEGNEVSEAQAEYFKDTKVRDKDGNLLLVHHGTKAEFNTFERDKIGSTGRFEGAGFNFTPSQGRAESYGTRVMTGYVNVTNPLSATQKTLTIPQLASIIREIDPTGDNIIANYAHNTNDYGTKAFIDRESRVTAREIWNYHDNDADIYSDISSADPDAESLIAKFESMGYDGVIHYNDDGSIKTVVAFSSEQFKNKDNLNPTKSGDVRYSIREIVGNDGHNYGKGVYLDSTLLTDLTDEERVEMVKEYIKELGGQKFTAFDANNKPVEVSIAKPNEKFKNQSGRRIYVNNDLATKYSKKAAKQESIALIDELITTARFEKNQSAHHPHGWLDNNGANNWEKWKTYVEDRDGNIWEATLFIANPADGRKILYDIYPIKKAGRSGTSDTIPADENYTTTSDKSQEGNEKKSLRDSDGKELSPAQAEFFKDSKAVDKNGNLLKLYHGTDADAFTEFIKQPMRHGKNYGEGFYFTPSKNDAYVWGSKNVFEVYLNITKPFYADERIPNDVRELLRTEVGKQYDKMSQDKSWWGNKYTREEWIAKKDFMWDYKSAWDALFEVGSVLEGEYINERRYYEEVGDRLTGWLKSFGYDGVIVEPNRRYAGEYVVFNSEQIKRTDNLNPTGSKDIRHQLRQDPIDAMKAHEEYLGRELTPRERLAYAFEGLASNDIERSRLEEYKDKIAKKNAQEARLREVQELLKTEKDKKEISKLRDEQTVLKNRLTTFDSQLLRMENAKPLKDIVNRQKELARKTTRERYQAKAKEELRAQREKYTEKMRELRQDRDEKIAETIQEMKDKQAAKKERMTMTEVRNKIRELHDEISRAIARPTKSAKVPIELRDSMVDILNAINMDYRGENEHIANLQSQLENETNPEKIAEINRKIKYWEDQQLKRITKETMNRAAVQMALERKNLLSEKIASLKAKYQLLSKGPDAAAYDKVIDEAIGRLYEIVGDTSLKNMSLEQLTMTYKILKAVWKAVNEANKLIGIEQATAQEFGEMVIRETLESKSVPFLRWVFDRQLPPEVFFDRMAGGKKNSNWLQLFNMTNEGQTQKLALQYKYNQMFGDLLQDKRFFNLRKDMIDIGLVDENGKPVEISREMMLAIYMHTLNEDNARHLIRGGMNVPSVKKYYRGDSEQAYATGVRVLGTSVDIAALTEKMTALEEKLEEDPNNEGLKSQLKALEAERQDMLDSELDRAGDIQKRIEAQMTDYDKSLVKAMQKFFEESALDLNAVTELVYGFSRANVENYFPIHSDRNFLSTDPETVKMDASLEGVGFMKERIHSANPIYLTGVTDEIMSQISKVSQYAGMMIPLKNYSRVMNTQTKGFTNSVRNAVLRTHGAQAIKILENFEADMNGARKSANAIGSFLRGNMAQAALTLNPSVTLAQSASYPTAAAVVGYKPLLKALVKGGKSGLPISRADLDLINKWTPLLWYRRQGYTDVALGDLRSMTDTVHKKLRFLTGWIQAMDAATVGRLWYAAEYYVQDNTALKKGSDEYYMKTAEIFNQIVERTQPNYTTLQRPDILRSSSELTKSLTMFMTQRLQNFGILYGSILKLSRYSKDFKAGANGVTAEDVQNAKAGVVHAITSQLLSAAVLVGMKSLVKLLMGKLSWKDDETGEYTAKSVGLGVLDLFLDTLAGTVVGGSELYELISSLVFKKNYYGLEVNGIAQVSDVATDIVNFAKAPSGMKAKKLAYAIAQLFGVPAQNVENMLLAPYRFVRQFELAEGNEVMDTIANVKDATKTQYSNRVWDAQVRNDTDKMETLRKVLGDKEYNNLLKTELRENSKELKTATKQYLASGTMNTNAVETTAHVSSAMAEDAVKSEATYLKGRITTMAKSFESDKAEYKKILKNLKERYAGVYTQDELIELMQERRKTL